MRCRVDINELIRSDFAFERIVGGTFDLLRVCDCKKLVVLSPRGPAAKHKYVLEMDENELRITLHRESVTSKYACAKVSRAVTVNGNTIRENDPRFLHVICDILRDIEACRAQMLAA